LHLDSWRYENIVYKTCNIYHGATVVDARWKSARAFSITALIFGPFVVILNIIAGRSRPEGYKAAVGPAYLLASLFWGAMPAKTTET